MNTDKYFLKYLKYKNKYLEKKLSGGSSRNSINNECECDGNCGNECKCNGNCGNDCECDCDNVYGCDSNSNNELKILIVVDVQNCFINGGSLGGASLMNSIKQMYEIEKLIDENTLIIFSRDFHPLGHRSFKVTKKNDKVVEGYFEPHCRNSENTCKTNYDEEIKKINKSIQFKDIYKDIITKSFLPSQNNYFIIDTLVDNLTSQILENKETYINEHTYISQTILNIVKQLETINYNNKSIDEIIIAWKKIIDEIIIAWEKITYENQQTDINIFINIILSILFIKNMINTDTYVDVDILGTQLSYLFLASKYKNVIYMLNQNNNNKIGLKKKIGLDNNQNIDQTYIDTTHIDTTDLLKDINYYDVKPIQHEDKYFVQITKGEYCNFESYSAFNYHLNYSEGFSFDEKTKLPCDRKYSTGLCEFIENFIKNNRKYNNCKPIITVCGLVGNICVMNTVHQGIIMTKFYKTLINAEFNYSALGTLWLLSYLDNLSKDNNIMIKDSDDYNKEIEFFQKDIIDVLKINNGTHMMYNIILSDNNYINLNYNNNTLQIQN